MSWADPKKWTAEAVEHRLQLKRARDGRYHRTHRHRKSGNWNDPFVGCDGEGYGKDERGRQIFALLRIGDAELYFDGGRLSTEECLEFVLAAPGHAQLVGYYFNYDVTMMLRDMPTQKLKRVLSEQRGYTYWRGYCIDWRPKRRFSVARLDHVTMKPVPKSVRTIREVSGYFRCSFLDALNKWNVGSLTQRALIADGKERRKDFPEIDEAARNYCQLECELLAELMEEVRDAFKETDLVPSAWEGPGYVAARLHRENGTPKADDLPHRSDKFTRLAHAAFYAGRFEVAQVGRMAGPVLEADLNSTYAAILPTLPCPRHTTWHPFKDLERAIADGKEFIADIVFDHDGRSAQLCHLPVRHSARLIWPRRGSGVYWSRELLPAMRAGAVIHNWGGGYAARRDCDCRPFEWVRPIYDRRLALGSDTLGYPIKIALAALYGKFIQASGAAPYRDIVAAGLVTATARGWLIDGYADHQHATVMLAGDAIYSTELLPLPYGTGLGEWSFVERPDLFVVQPGLYWSSKGQPKTKGIPRSAVIDRRTDFEALWDGWLTSDCHGRVPQLGVHAPLFIGYNLAMGLGDIGQACRWKNQLNRISFSWRSKRGDHFIIENGHAQTVPLKGSFDLRSEVYDTAALTDYRRRELEDEAMPDFTPWGNQGE
jgi:hypothetical protein